jgi:hypothetical protein
MTEDNKQNGKLFTTSSYRLFYGWAVSGYQKSAPSH